MKDLRVKTRCETCGEPKAVEDFLKIDCNFFCNKQCYKKWLKNKIIDFFGCLSGTYILFCLPIIILTIILSVFLSTQTFKLLIIIESVIIIISVIVCFICAIFRD